MHVIAGFNYLGAEGVLYLHIPREMIERPKKGFFAPLWQWLRGPLWERAGVLLGERCLGQEGYLAPSIVRRVKTECLLGSRDHSHRLWAILMFQGSLEKQ